MKKTVEGLNQLVAELTVVYQKLRHFHWHVEGKDFLTLHVKFEEIYTSVNTIIDELAERVVALGGKSVASLKEVLKRAKAIKESSNYPADSKMVKELIKDIDELCKLIAKTAGKINEKKDRHSINLLDNALDILEGHVWMLKALKIK